nr:CAT RNA binding domain-containing protein [Streptococcus sinensis]
MIITKILNNNVVLSEAEGQEVILMGCGLAFGRKVGDEIPTDLIEKRYVSSEQERNSSWICQLKSWKWPIRLSLLPIIIWRVS